MLDYAMCGYNNHFKQKHIHTLVQYNHFSLNHNSNMIAEETKNLGHTAITNKYEPKPKY